uniref:Dihydrolipoyl dehydrogenase n=1 Tax=Thermodesulfovibrio aggregans TaxID=86166 RepID=A0A7C4AIY1_9BACT
MKVLVIGGGPAGYVSALTARRLGAEVVLIEKNELGGTCLNRGCIPTKTFIYSLELLDKFKNQKYSNHQSFKISVDLATLMQRKDNVVETQKKGLGMLLKQAGINIINDEAELINPKTVILRKFSKEIKADRIIVATGSRPAQLPMLDFDGEKILSSNELWNLKNVPQSITIIGAGAIGCEFAWIFHLLGSKVSLIELMPRVLPMEDEEISKALERLFRKRKIDFYTGTKIEDLKKNHDSIEITLSDRRKIKSDIVLVSVGRAYNTELLNNTDVRLGNKKEIIVDDYMQSSIEGVYAAGDVNGKWLLAHVAYREGEVAAKNALGNREKMDYTGIPSTIFTVSQVASAGLKEFEAVQKGINIKKASFPFRAIGKAHVTGEIDGFVKVIVDTDSDTIIGAHIIGPVASEIIHELALAIKLKAKAKQLKQLIHSHPTLSECIGEAVADIHGEAIHKLER